MKKTHFALIGSGVFLVLMAVLWFAQPVRAAQAGAAANQSDPPAISNETCLSCHAQPDQYMTLLSGEEVYITVDPAGFAASIHGSQGYACVQCHREIEGYPHPERDIETRRELTVELNSDCAYCHNQQADLMMHSAHGMARESGNTNAPVCSDCHGSHDVTPPLSRVEIPQTCATCHSTIYAEYAQSVHGAALLENNPDVPTCIDCHGVHDLQSARDPNFHADSPDLCAKCHNDPELMAQYGIRSDIFDTYVADFHGTSAMLFEPDAPGQQLDKAVCIDCHGVHSMQRISEQETAEMQQNLLISCQRCHPDANANFPAAWMSHYRPSREHYPVVFYINLFYWIVIPLLVGGMLVFVILDGIRTFSDRRKERHHG